MKRSESPQKSSIHHERIHHRRVGCSSGAFIGGRAQNEKYLNFFSETVRRDADSYKEKNKKKHIYKEDEGMKEMIGLFLRLCQITAFDWNENRSVRDWTRLEAIKPETITILKFLHRRGRRMGGRCERDSDLIYVRETGKKLPQVKLEKLFRGNC